jgi:hypothetical protein
VGFVAGGFAARIKPSQLNFGFFAHGFCMSR